MGSRSVVEIDVARDPRLGLADRVVGVEVGEWHRGIAPLRSPRTGREPLDSSGSYRSIVMIAALQCGKNVGARWRNARSQSHARMKRPRSFLYFRCAQRTRSWSSVLRARCKLDGWKSP